MSKKKIDVCLTPELVHLSDLKGKLVVVVDIFRATSCMVSGLATGINHIIPVAKVEECLAYRPQGYLLAGERGGQKLEEFDMGNSPYEYMDASRKGRSVAVTTTNGTLAIKKSEDAAEIIIGSFLNLSSIVNYVQASPLDVVVHCAGWKGTFNLEDTTFAGAMIERLAETHAFDTDAAFMSQLLWQRGKQDLSEFLLQSAHAHRLQKFGITKDLQFCSTIDEFDVLPVLKGERITI